MAPQEKVTALFEAVKSGDLAKVKEIVDSKVMALAKNQQGQSPLHLAVLNNHMEIVQHLLTEYPGTVSCKDNVSTRYCHLLQQ